MDAARQLLRRAREVAADPAGDVPSPCVSVCRMDPRTQLCEGCFRTLDEIAAWSRLENTEKRGVWRSIARRALQDAVIPAAEAGIQANTVIPAEAGIQANTVIPAEAGIQANTVIPAKAGIQSFHRLDPRADDEEGG